MGQSGIIDVKGIYRPCRFSHREDMLMKLEQRKAQIWPLYESKSMYSCEEFHKTSSLASE